MSQQQKLERVLDLFLSEDTDRASELLHQIIVEKARTIYESIVDEEDEVGGDTDTDFTSEISSDEDEIDSDHQNDGEPELDDESDDEDEFGGDATDDEDGDVEDRVGDLESQLADLRAEFDELMGEEMQEPNHSDLGDEFDDEDDFDNEFDDEGELSTDYEDEVEPAGDNESTGTSQVVGEIRAHFGEAKKSAKTSVGMPAEKLEVAKQTKKLPKGKKVDEETQFLTKTADTGQRGTAKLVGTGKGMTLGAEQTKSPYTNIPGRKDYGGKPVKIATGTGGEYGKYNGDSAADKTVTDNTKIAPKKYSGTADTTAKFTGGKTAGDGFSKSPLSKKPGTSE